MTDLEKQIAEYSQKYYTDGSSPISDAEFDVLLEKQRQIDPNSPLLGIGHGYEISLDDTAGEKVPHKYNITVGSLPKIHSWDETTKDFRNDILNSNSVVASLKLDGLSVCTYWKNGEFIQAITRGNGKIGIDITNKVKKLLTAQNSLKIDSSFSGAIRGELIMSYENFNKFKPIYDSTHPDNPAKNPRNSAAGIINADGFDYLEYINLVVYTVVADESAIDNTCKKYSQYLDFLKDNFNYVVPYGVDNNIESDFLNKMNKYHDMWYNTYPADGIVLAVNSCTNNNAEILYNSMAYKFPTESVETKVIDVEWTMSRIGYYIPVVHFEPVEIDGTNVERASGQNLEFITANQIDTGAIIEVTKANLIIPYITSVKMKAPSTVVPNKCPVCNAPFIVENKQLRCANPECNNAKFYDTLVWFKTLAPVDGLGDTLITQYLTQTLGEDVSVEAIYKHGQFKDTFSKYVKEELFKKTFNRLFTDKFDLAIAIQALNIPRFGDKTSVKLVEFPEAVKQICKDTSNIPVIDIGDANYKSLVKYSSKFSRLNFIYDQINWETNTTKQESKGNVCITGKLSRKRSEVEAELIKLGFTPVSSVNKDTKYLITDDFESGSSKNVAADKYGVTKIHEAEFFDMFRTNSTTASTPKSSKLFQI